MRTAHREIRKMLAPIWDDFEIEVTRGGHVRIVLKLGQDSTFVVCPATPSDRRERQNTLSQVRRSIRTLKEKQEVKLS